MNNRKQKEEKNQATIRMQYCRVARGLYFNEGIKVNTAVLPCAPCNHLCILLSHLANFIYFPPIILLKYCNINDDDFHHFIQRNGPIRKMQGTITVQF